MLQRLHAALAVTMLALAGVVCAAEDLGYDPQADPFVELAEGAARAKVEGKVVLLIAGGDWCVWCHYLNAFIKNDAEVMRAVDETFVIVKVYYGDETHNEPFFSQWPKADGYPHFWIFSGDGNLLASQPTVVLEDGGKSYDKNALLAFVDRWRGRG